MPPTLTSGVAASGLLALQRLGDLAATRVAARRGLHPAAGSVARTDDASCMV